LVRTIEVSPCVHHDIIEVPNGPISIGTCKKCGREREYENFKWPDYNIPPAPAIKEQKELIWNG
ncbi:hypothetical protein LCGC14_1971880, partial [marine sediment metagenome]